MTLPAILYASDLRPLLGWTQQRTREFLERNGVARRDAKGRVYTTPLLMREHFPDALAAIEWKWEAKGSKFDPDDFSDLEVRRDESAA
jgi:hypothetical protein